MGELTRLHAFSVLGSQDTPPGPPQQGRIKLAHSYLQGLGGLNFIGE